jgi:hypothetical protein
MSKKKLLSEAQIRRFQGLAGLPAIGEANFSGFGSNEENIDEMGHEHMGARDEEEPELPGDEGPVDDMGMGPEEMGDEEMGDEEMGDELEISDEGGDNLDLSPEQKESLAADIVRAVAQELGNALDLDEPIEVDVEDDAGEMDLGGEMDLELGDEPVDDLGGDLDVEEPAPEPEDELALEEGEEEEELAEVLDDEAIVNEVLRRVVARLANK